MQPRRPWESNSTGFLTPTSPVLKHHIASPWQQAVSHCCELEISVQKAFFIPKSSLGNLENFDLTLSSACHNLFRPWTLWVRLLSKGGMLINCCSQHEGHFYTYGRGDLWLRSLSTLLYIPFNALHLERYGYMTQFGSTLLPNTIAKFLI
ncbi:hypothetical protein BY996DRAFT_6418727 [Phakopsora pachyrhizi]|nr:hypothetical protein BY996DRAFT_6418727 [Phakopsora pachyrhizi]